ncbi:biotin synthase BioB [Haloimpatiens sp. FM7315]|uniref:biotin synthase BioB n=1 Tax=Haloimpatiens sp. FM7315 TaxID=3298609 RepID=UPI0035A26DEC
MENIILKLENKINKGETINFEEALLLSNVENTEELLKAADQIRIKFNGKNVELCSIMNAKSGRCSEDCKYCAQSAHYCTNVEEYNLVDEKKALKLALENEHEGVNKFSLVTSGRGLMGDDFEKILDIYKYLKKNVKIKLCASLGIIDYSELSKLKKAGVLSYHHNLETSRDYYKKICTTHTYDERIETIINAKKAGLKICSGGIIGMGETMEDRIKLALELQNLEIESIPINVLNPIKGTPLENTPPLTQEEILKTIAIFRFINPKAYIRLAGGRNLLENFGESCFKAGVNATITGNYLTTSGNKISEDIQMIKNLGLEIKIDE